MRALCWEIRLGSLELLILCPPGDLGCPTRASLPSLANPVLPKDAGSGSGGDALTQHIPVILRDAAPLLGRRRIPCTLKMRKDRAGGSRTSQRGASRALRPLVSPLPGGRGPAGSAG